ncbi:hypothetical protein PCA01_39480 [Pseudoalteromonas carrageenovora]|nr:hypothetical protein PCA01_39480 [Pseudoalteromonas carrageenovora]
MKRTTLTYHSPYLVSDVQLYDLAPNWLMPGDNETEIVRLEV